MIIMRACFFIVLMFNATVSFGMADEAEQEIKITKMISEVHMLDAVIKYNFERVKLCLECGEDINVKGDVIAKNADVNGPNLRLQNVNALMIASIYFPTKIMKHLIEEGIELDAVDDFGNTALMMAAWHGRYDVVRKLVRAGVDIMIRNKEGLTALQEVENSSYIASHPYLYKTQNGCHYNANAVRNLLRKVENNPDYHLCKSSFERKKVVLNMLQEKKDNMRLVQIQKRNKGLRCNPHESIRLLT